MSSCVHFLGPNPYSASPEIRTLKGNHKTVYLLGTWHKAHLYNPKYTWHHFARIFSLLSPELVLVEIRPQHFKPNEYLDGPIEMSYFVYLASTAGIRCAGIDYFPDSLKVDWEYRNDRMVENIIQALNQYRDKVILTVVGYNHVEPIMDRLKKYGYTVIHNYDWNLLIDAYPSLPQPVIDMWSEGLCYLIDYQRTLPPGSPAAKKIEEKIAYIKKAIKYRGYCFKRQ
jgi:hypothetical protein